MCSRGGMRFCSRTPEMSTQPTPSTIAGANRVTSRMSDLAAEWRRSRSSREDDSLELEKQPRDAAEYQEGDEEDEPPLGQVHESLAEGRVDEEDQEPGEEDAES